MTLRPARSGEDGSKLETSMVRPIQSDGEDQMKSPKVDSAEYEADVALACSAVACRHLPADADPPGDDRPQLGLGCSNLQSHDWMDGW